jgi:hypothetical protein
MASAAMIHFGLDPGKIMRWLGGKYTGKRRDVNYTLVAVKDHVSTDNFNHMTRILLDGSPFKLTFEKPLNNKSVMIQQGNSKSFNENLELVLQTMNKEDCYSHILPLDLDKLLCTFSPTCRHTAQTLVIKPGKNNCLCYDALTTHPPSNIVMNHATTVVNKAPITFGMTKLQFLIDM